MTTISEIEAIVMASNVNPFAGSTVGTNMLRQIGAGVTSVTLDHFGLDTAIDDKILIYYKFASPLSASELTDLLDLDASGQTNSDAAGNLNTELTTVDMAVVSWSDINKSQSKVIIANMLALDEPDAAAGDSAREVLSIDSADEQVDVAIDNIKLNKTEDLHFTEDLNIVFNNAEPVVVNLAELHDKDHMAVFPVGSIKDAKLKMLPSGLTKYGQSAFRGSPIFSEELFFQKFSKQVINGVASMTHVAYKDASDTSKGTKMVSFKVSDDEADRIEFLNFNNNMRPLLGVGESNKLPGYDPKNVMRAAFDIKFAGETINNNNTQAAGGGGAHALPPIVDNKDGTFSPVDSFDAAGNNSYLIHTLESDALFLDYNDFKSIFVWSDVSAS